MPSAPFLVPPMLLIVILVVSALAKLHDHPDTVSGFGKLALPRRDGGAAAIAARLPVWQEQVSPVRVHLVSGTEWAEARSLCPDLAGELLGDPDDELRVRLRVLPFPGAVLLGTDRRLAGGPVSGMVALEELVRATAEELQAASQPQ